MKVEAYENSRGESNPFVLGRRSAINVFKDMYLDELCYGDEK